MMIPDAKATFFAYGYGGWGKSENLKEAIKLARQNAWTHRKTRLSNSDFTVTVYLCSPDEITVNDFFVYAPEGTERIPLWESKVK